MALLCNTFYRKAGGVCGGLLNNVSNDSGRKKKKRHHERLNLFSTSTISHGCNSSYFLFGSNSPAHSNGHIPEKKDNKENKQTKEEEKKPNYNK